MAIESVGVAMEKEADRRRVACDAPTTPDPVLVVRGIRHGAPCAGPVRTQSGTFSGLHRRGPRSQRCDLVCVVPQARNDPQTRSKIERSP